MHELTSKKIEALKELFRTHKVLSLPEMLAVLKINSQRTAMRYLQKLDYLSSYNQRGKYYTREEIAQFNDHGIWIIDSVGFSKHGTLKNTLAYLISHSEKGMTASELQLITHCVVKDALLDLVENNSIHRIKRGQGVYLYLNNDQRKAKKQLGNRIKKAIDAQVKNPNSLYSYLSNESNISEMIGKDSVDDELLGINLGDERLNKRIKKMLCKMFHGVGFRLPAVFKGKRELDAAYSLFQNDLVTPEKIFNSHINTTLERIKQFSTVLLIQDTTEINMKHMSGVEGLGVLNDTDKPGCSCHPLIAFTPERLCLGVVSNEFMIRPLETLGKKEHNNLRKIEDKESFRWIRHFRTACIIAEKSPGTKIIVVADREADIYELFLETKNQLAHLVVRLWHDRKLNQKSKSPNQHLMLMNELRKTPIMGTISFEVPPARGREKRKVKQNIRCREFEFHPSAHKGNLPTIKINVVFLEEIKPPKGEEPCDWIIGTTLPINTMEEVQLVIDTYLARWGIETFFKVMKSGCLIEKTQFQSAVSLLNCVALYMIIAWRLMYITYLGRTCPEIPCTVLFEKDEWQSVYAIVKKCKPPETPILLGDFTEMIAVLGGYLKRKNMHPGPKVMWIGLQLMRGCSYGWAAAKRFASG